MISIHKLIYKHDIFDGTQRLYRFENNFGASVVRHSGSYGGNDGLYELAVIRWDPKANITLVENGPYKRITGWTVCYSTAITHNAIGYLEEDQVNTVLSFIEKLNGSGKFNNDEVSRAWEKFFDELRKEKKQI